MTDVRPAVFDAGVVGAVASETGIEEDVLDAGLRAVQSVVADHGSLSVDDVVYEWRTQFHADPLVSQTPTAYYLDVREHVWDDVAERANESLDVLAGVRRVHAAQFAADRGGDAPPGAMVLAKP